MISPLIFLSLQISIMFHPPKTHHQKINLNGNSCFCHVWNAEIEYYVVTNEVSALIEIANEFFFFLCRPRNGENKMRNCGEPIRKLIIHATLWIVMIYTTLIMLLNVVVKCFSIFNFLAISAINQKNFSLLINFYFVLGVWCYLDCLSGENFILNFF